MPLKTVEDLARHLAVDAGFDPDEPVMLGMLQYVEIKGQPGISKLPHSFDPIESIVLFPAWMHFRQRAKVMAVGFGLFPVDWQEPFDALAGPHWKITKQENNKD